MALTVKTSKRIGRTWFKEDDWLIQRDIARKRNWDINQTKLGQERIIWGTLQSLEITQVTVWNC